MYEVTPPEAQKVTIGGLKTTLEESVVFTIGPGAPEVVFADGMRSPHRAYAQRIRTRHYGGEDPETVVSVFFSTVDSTELSSWSTGKTPGQLNTPMPFQALPAELKEATLRALNEVIDPTGAVDFCP